MDEKTHCDVCGVVDEHYDEASLLQHNSTPKHISNKILQMYNEKKRYFAKNRDGVKVYGRCKCLHLSHKENDYVNIPVLFKDVEYSDHQKIRIETLPFQHVRFAFSMHNELRNEDILIVGATMAHPQPQFTVSQNPYVFGAKATVFERQSFNDNEVVISFVSPEIGQYEMPIIFTFNIPSEDKNIIIVREMVASVSEERVEYPFTRTPYTKEVWEQAEHIIYAPNMPPQENTFKIPKLLKTLLPNGLEDTALENIKGTPELKAQLRNLLTSVNKIFEIRTTESNYASYFHYLLWWEEIVAKIGLKRYNMFNVPLEIKSDVYLLEVPGLAEKRPSLIRGDRLFIRPREESSIIFESSIKDLSDTHIQMGSIDEAFHMYGRKDAMFDVRFLLTRVPFERMHGAVNALFSSKQVCKVFPKAPKHNVPARPITKFYNLLIRENEEQKSAVEHIVSGCSGLVPYIVFGPPGTGKTITIVEAIVQLVARNNKNRIMVCTDSNMAADHIAVALLQYNKALNIKYYLLRASSQTREWTSMPSVLAPVSNGSSYDTFYTVKNSQVAKYRIFVTTLLHAAKYGSPKNQKECRLQMTHLFIDEAAQASEPATLVPITGLLSQGGHLVLAGDPQQLGPICFSREAKRRGLNISLMERLKDTYSEFYDHNPNYITMLVKNFRSDPDILRIPNELFYNNCLQAMAKPDPISRISILNLPGGERAVVFHAVNSQEQRMGNAPSYYNEKELEILKKYVIALVETHLIPAKSIGIIAPYIRQVYKVKGWLASMNLKDIEVGTVESFQGKEKRVILVSTVRANCRLLDYDAKYGLGFLVDDKRYNVTLTRAKAKLVIIGNPACLKRDLKWRKYISLCLELECYYGQKAQQMERTGVLLHSITHTKFDKIGLYGELKPLEGG